MSFNSGFQSFTGTSGFNDPDTGAARQQAALDVLNHLESLIQDGGQCNILFAQGALAMPEIVWTETAYTDVTPGFHAGDAHENIVNGVDPDPATLELTVFVRFDVPWYTGDAICVGCGYDLRTYLLAAVVSGLGLQSAIGSDGNSTIAPGVYTRWDRLLMTGRGEPLLQVQSGTPVFVASPNALLDAQTGIRLNGAQAAEALGEPPFMNVTGQFSPSASLQYFAGGTTLDAVKEPLADNTIVRRRLTPADIGALRDIGYDVADLPADVTVNTLTDTFDQGDTSSVDTLNQFPGPDGISLREAIQATNGTPGSQTIRFGVSGVIQPVMNLPEIIDNGTYIEAEGNVTLDGSIQDGSLNGLVVQYSNCLIRGLRFVNFAGYAIALRSYGFGGGNRVLGCWIGLDADGMPGTNNSSGILIENSSSNVIGGTVSSARNVVAGMTNGAILIDGYSYGADGNVIIGNYIGLDPTGTVAIPNAGTGLYAVFAFDTGIGSVLQGGRNIFGANSYAAIVIESWYLGKQEGSSRTARILNNYIGTSADGNTGLANGGAGVELWGESVEVGGDGDTPGNVLAGGLDPAILVLGDSSGDHIIANNRIGIGANGQNLGNVAGIVFTSYAGYSSVLDNIIAGNSGDGVLLETATSVILEGNFIGTDATGSEGLGNGGDGIRIVDSYYSGIGSVEFGGNTIAHNGGAGVRVDGSSEGNSILNNSIHSNTEGGILIADPAHPGATPPLITSVNPLQGTAPPFSIVELFADNAAQGRLFITRYVLDGTGVFSSIEDLSAYDGMNITATATLDSEQPPSTSMFSEPKQIDVSGPVITILGNNPLQWQAAVAYMDPGATALDNVDGDLTSLLIIGSTVSPFVPGDYVVTYQVFDSAGHEAVAQRQVVVADTLAPDLVLAGATTVTVDLGDPYVEPGFFADDLLDGNLTGAVQVSGTVDTGTAGTYMLTYSVADAAGNYAEATRTVQVVSKQVPEVSLAVNPLAAPAGTPFSFTATPEVTGNYSYTWDFGGLGSSQEQNPTFYFEGAAPASYEITVLVESDEGDSRLFSVLVTVTSGLSAGAGRVVPDEETIITVDEGPLLGAWVIVPPGALDNPLVISISEVDDPPTLLAGTINQLVRLEPSGLQFNVPVTVRIPHPMSWYHQDAVEALYYSVSLQEWRRDGISNARHGEGDGYHYVAFETTHFTVFMSKSLVPSGIQGQVFSTDGDPLDGATVTIDPAGLNLTCDATGFYTTITDLTPGAYTVVADNTGFCEAEELVNVGTADLERQDFELEKQNTDGSCGNNNGGGGCHGEAPRTNGAMGDIVLLTILALALAYVRSCDVGGATNRPETEESTGKRPSY